MRNIFNRILDKKTNEEIQEWVKNHIGIETYSYHQINIFIKLFISQYDKFKGKSKFLVKNNDDVTVKCIKEFVDCTQYFTNVGFSRLMTGIDKYNEREEELDILSNIYEDDLKSMKFPIPLIFIIKEKLVYEKLKIPDNNSEE